MSGINNRAALNKILQIHFGDTKWSDEALEALSALLIQAEREAELVGKKQLLKFLIANYPDETWLVPMLNSVNAALVALQVGPQGAGEDLGDSDSSGGVSRSEQIKSYATPDEPTEGSL